MADYIDKSILVEAYVRLNKNIDDLSPDQIVKIQVNLQQFAAERSQFFLYADVDTEVNLEEGSIIAWLTVIGSFYVLISQYPDFRTGVRLLYSDAKRLSESLISETMFELNGKAGSVIRIEARVGIIGNINNIVNKLSAAEAMDGEIDVRRTNKILEQVSLDIDSLFQNLSKTDDRKCLKENLLILAQRIPAKPRNPKRRDHPPQDVAHYEDLLKNLLQKIRTLPS